MDQTKLAIIRAVRDMARADGRLHRQERKILRLIAEAEQLDPEEKEYLQRTSEPLAINELRGLLPDSADRLRLLELSVLVGMADGVESPDELDRLRKLTKQLEISRDDVEGCLERARERFFELTRVWEKEQ
jgi:tellurite resistance protein